MGSVLLKGMRAAKFTQDIPQLTEYLANDPTFIKWALKVNRNTNKGLSRFQRILHESAFPDDANSSGSNSRGPNSSINHNKYDRKN